MKHLHLFKSCHTLFASAIFLWLILIGVKTLGQSTINWSTDGNAYYKFEKEQLFRYDLPANAPTVVLSKTALTPPGKTESLTPEYYRFSADGQKVLLFTNTQKVWRLNTRGDYWVLDIASGKLTRLGQSLPASSLMFAKFSPDATKVAYVSGNNLYMEDVATSQIKPLTTDGTGTLINGTFDWAYEEEFACRDGFRWSPDGQSIAYWQLDASSIKKFYMINNTDSIYSQPIPLEYPKVGETPSSCRVGVVSLANAQTTWLNIPGDPKQHYLVRMEFIPNTSDLLIQQLNRKQNESKLFVANAQQGTAKSIFEEKDQAWVDVYDAGNQYAIDFTNTFIWLNKGKEILWSSEKDGWRHLYRISLEGKKETLVTRGNYDFIELEHVNEKEGFVHVIASPENATQKYLYRTPMSGKGKLQLISPAAMKGTHGYDISPNGRYALHTFTNHYTPRLSEIITLAGHRPLNEKESIAAQLPGVQEKPKVEFFKITTADDIEMDGWMAKPADFDPGKKYPVVFFVYSEPASATVSDTYRAGKNSLYKGDMAADGYIYISLDNRGTPAPKGREWRKSIYRKIGMVNIRDQAMAAQQILKWNFVDSERVAVWGWSGGGSASLNLLFQYPDIYKTGISIAAVGNQLTYDNIYQERYMGLPGENKEDFINGSPITHAKNLEGNLLYIHGTGDDNVHYQNAELLVDELIKHNKQFQFMPYPNRTHSISEGEGTFEHLSTLYTNFLKTHCPPGGK